MGLLSWFFRSKEEKEEAKVQPVRENSVLCDSCGEEILPHEKRNKYHGKRFHKRCWRTLKRSVFQ